MIKLFASDLDGTLLNRFHLTDKKIRNGINTINASGLYFTVATGRIMNIKDIKRNFKDCTIYTISMNGAIVRDTNGNVLLQRNISSTFIHEILTNFRDLSLECSSVKKTYVMTTKKQHTKQVKKFRKLFKYMPNLLIHWYFTNYKYEATSNEIEQDTILKINCRYVPENRKKEFDDFLKEYINEVENAPYADGFYEITSKDVTKSTALQFLAKHLDIQHDEIAVYGDGNNDLEMLRDFKNSYAPSSGGKKAKATANTIIGPSHKYSVINHILTTIKSQKEI